MADAVAQTGAKMPKKPPMALGPIPKPEMRRLCLGMLKTWSPLIVASAFASYGLGYFFLYRRHRVAYDNYLQNLDPDKLYREMLEMGAFKSYKPSWQQD